MNYLKIYKNGQYYGRKFSLDHLKNGLEKKYINIQYLKTENNEIARIRADGDIFQVFDEI